MDIDEIKEGQKYWWAYLSKKGVFIGWRECEVIRKYGDMLYVHLEKDEFGGERWFYLNKRWIHKEKEEGKKCEDPQFYKC